MKKSCLCLCILILFLAKTTLELPKYCSVHISEFMVQGLGLCTKCELFICKQSL